MRKRPPDARVVYQVASWCLDYPDERFVERLSLLRDAIAEQPRTEAVVRLAALVDQLANEPIEKVRLRYVDLFDLDRRHALHLSYWTDGDTRRRGQVLAEFKAAYRAGGFLVDTGGELPDYLPMVLEFGAVCDLERGRALLAQYRPSLELLRIALSDTGTPYADAVRAVCETLPGASPKDRAAVMALAGAAPPVETVGLEPYDARPLPLHDITHPHHSGAPR